MISGENHHFIVELPLSPEKWQEDIMNSRYDIGRFVYNAALRKFLNIYKEMIKTKKYRTLFESLSNKECDKKDVWKQINKMTEDHGITKNNVIKSVKLMQHKYKCHIHSQICQEIAVNVWKAIKSILHKPNKHVHFKKYGTFNTFKGTEPRKGIAFNLDCIEWTGLKIKIHYSNCNSSKRYYNNYLFPSLDRLCYCMIVRKEIRGKYRYYVQIVFNGTDVKDRYKLGNGRVGIDIGTSTIAISSDTVVTLQELAKEAQKYEEGIKEVQRKMDRSKRKTNPNKFNEDGTVKKGNNDKWNYSSNYKKLLKQLRELYRLQKFVRKLSHNTLTNFLLTLGNEFFVESMNYSALAKRSKKPTERKSDGKCKRKKRFGKSICNRAPSMLISILARKLSYFDIDINKLNTWTCKASQFNHITGEFTKKPLSKRWNSFDGILVQRDLYSAFLISNAEENLDRIDRQLCFDKFNNFLKLHDEEISKLKQEKQQTNCKFLSCMGI